MSVSVNPVSSQSNQSSQASKVTPSVGNKVTPSVDKVTSSSVGTFSSIMEDEEIAHLDKIKNILDVDESQYPSFVLAKNKSRFKKKLVWYKAKKDWLDVAPLYKVNKLFKQQSKELEVIRSNKLDYEMELETGSLTASQRTHRKDELKMCKIHEKMAIQLITKMQLKFKLCR